MVVRGWFLLWWEHAVRGCFPFLVGLRVVVAGVVVWSLGSHLRYLLVSMFSFVA